MTMFQPRRVGRDNQLRARMLFTMLLLGLVYGLFLWFLISVAGATVMLGGGHDGRFYEPTVLTGVTPDMRIYNEETFGPVVSLIPAEDSEEALSIANDTAYGLSAAVITNDLQKAFDLSLRLESGMVHVNDCTISDEPHVPFGGVKDSGFGREGGRYSIEEMTEVKWITVQLGKREFPF